MLSKRLNNPGKTKYAGRHMQYTYALPGAISIASTPEISSSARRRLKWMDHYHKYRNASLTCRHFGISRKTFYLWQKRYNPYHLESLEERSKRPKNTRQWQVSRMQEFRILALRRRHIRYGKEKLKRLYENEHQERVSSWKIQRVIEKHQIYYHPLKTEKLRKKRKHNQVKKRITELKKETRTGFLVALDTLVRYWAGTKRYILTAVDVHSKVAFARMYPSHHSKHAADFLNRLHYLLNGRIENLQTDNGSEFAKHFEEAAETLKLPHYLSRPKTPTDNPFDERFNRTLNEEFIQMGHMTSNCEVFNKNLTEWLIEYNFKRPHQTLGYETPINYNYRYHKVLPMYPSSTAT